MLNIYIKTGKRNRLVKHLNPLPTIFYPNIIELGRVVLLPCRGAK